MLEVMQRLEEVEDWSISHLQLSVHPGRTKEIASVLCKATGDSPSSQSEITLYIAPAALMSKSIRTATEKFGMKGPLCCLYIFISYVSLGAPEIGTHLPT